jgi:hypothetical protein
MSAKDESSRHGSAIKIPPQRRSIEESLAAATVRRPLAGFVEQIVLFEGLLTEWGVEVAALQ